MSSPAVAASSSVQPNATTYNGAKRLCLCKKEINLVSKQTRCKCSKCGWNFCNSDCRKRYKKEHAVNCAINNGLSAFMRANRDFFFVFGAWLKSRDDNTNYVGLRIEIPDDPSAEVRATPFNQQSYDILLQKVHGKPTMSSAGYPDFFAVMVSWKGTMICHELDLVKRTPPNYVQSLANVGCILQGDSPLFDDKNAGLFIVPPAGAMKGDTRQGWMASFIANEDHPTVDVPRAYYGFEMWRKLVKEQ
jgi:hypothetical protein